MLQNDLRFIAPARAAGWQGWCTLAVGGVFLFFVLRQYLDLQGDVEMLRNSVATQRALLPTAPAKLPPPDPQTEFRWQQVQRIKKDMQRDWSGLFTMIESAQNNDVGLLSILPDAQRGTVLISGEARDLTAATDYVRRLGRTPRLHQVVLTAHEVQEKEPFQPVRFAVSAQWGSGGAP